MNSMVSYLYIEFDQGHLQSCYISTLGLEMPLVIKHQVSIYPPILPLIRQEVAMMP
jgi:hypothetical protein